MKKVYTCFCTDIIHSGHINIIKEAEKYGEVTVGVLSDEASVRYNRFPTISFEERMRFLGKIIFSVRLFGGLVGYQVIKQKIIIGSEIMIPFFSIARIIGSCVLTSIISLKMSLRR